MLTTEEELTAAAAGGWATNDPGRAREFNEMMAVDRACRTGLAVRIPATLARRKVMAEAMTAVSARLEEPPPADEPFEPTDADKLWLATDGVVDVRAAERAAAELRSRNLMPFDFRPVKVRDARSRVVRGWTDHDQATHAGRV